LLFREVGEFALFKSKEGLNGTNSGECPAGTARSLVLNAVQNTLASPVDAVSDGVLDSQGGASGFGDQQVQVGLSEFLRSQVHELVLLKIIGVIRVIVEALDVIVVVVIDSQSVPFLVGVILFLAILLLPSEVTLDDLVRDSGERDCGLLLVHHVDCATQ
jgi:hypothetical protein